jgi:hypothetical protein
MPEEESRPTCFCEIKLGNKYLSEVAIRIDLKPLEVNKDIAVDIRVYMSLLYPKPQEGTADKFYVNVRAIFLTNNSDQFL